MAVLSSGEIFPFFFFPSLSHMNGALRSVCEWRVVPAQGLEAFFFNE